MVGSYFSYSASVFVREGPVKKRINEISFCTS